MKEIWGIYVVTLKWEPKVDMIGTGSMNQEWSQEYVLIFMSGWQAGIAYADDCSSMVVQFKVIQNNVSLFRYCIYIITVQIAIEP